MDTGDEPDNTTALIQLDLLRSIVAGQQDALAQTAQGVAAGGDLIVAVDGKSVRDSSEVANAISQKRPGDKVEITYYRGDSKKTVTVELAKRPNSAPASPSQGGDGLP